MHLAGSLKAREGDEKDLDASVLQVLPLRTQQPHPWGLVKPHRWAPPLEEVRWGLRTGFSIKFPGDVGAAGPGPHVDPKLLINNVCRLLWGQTGCLPQAEHVAPCVSRSLLTGPRTGPGTC